MVRVTLPRFAAFFVHFDKLIRQPPGPLCPPPIRDYVIYGSPLIPRGEILPIVESHRVTKCGLGFVEASHCQPVTIFFWSNLQRHIIKMGSTLS